MKEYLGLPTTRCIYLKARGRCFRQTTRQDSRCYYHTKTMLGSRKPKRLSLKKLYWAFITPSGKLYYEGLNTTIPWLSEVHAYIPVMPPPGYERIQVQLVVQKRGVCLKDKEGKFR